MTEVHVLTRRKPSGWSNNMLVVPLPDGGTLLHSPTWLGEETFERVLAFGEPRVLFAPNHFHHLSLPRFRQRFPDALPVASAGALPRLRDKGHEGLRPLAEATPLLPEGARWLETQGTRTGETWLSLPGGALLVCDSFFRVTEPLTGPEGLLLRALKVGPGLTVGRTTRWLAVSKPAEYRRWALDTLEQLRPTRVFFSHGSPLEGADVTQRLRAVVAAWFGSRGKTS